MKIIIKTPTRKNFRFEAIEIDTDAKTYKEIHNFLCADVVVYNKKALEDTKLTLDNLGFTAI